MFPVRKRSDSNNMFPARKRSDSNNMMLVSKALSQEVIFFSLRSYTSLTAKVSLVTADPQGFAQFLLQSPKRQKLLSFVTDHSLMKNQKMY